MTRHEPRSIRQYVAGAFLGALLLALLIPQFAAAQGGCRSLPGRAGIEQYCEDLPSAGGGSGGGGSDRDSGSSRSRGGNGGGGSGGSGGSGGGGSSVSQEARSGLAGAGPEGKQLLELTEDARGTAVKNPRKGSGAAASAQAAAQPVDDDPLSAVKSALGLGDSVGAGFVWVLLGIVVVFFALFWVRFRRRAAG